MDSFVKASEATESSLGRTPLEQLSLFQAQSEITPGEYWCIKKDGEDWPVVICDEEIVQRFFKSKQRPANARRSDGTWAKNFAGSKCYPAVIPGTLKLCWPGSKALEIFDSEMGQAIRASTTNPLLATAWDEAIEREEEKKDIAFWKAKLASREKARLRAWNRQYAKDDTRVTTPDGSDELSFDEKQGEVRVSKRKGTPKFRFPPGYARVEVDDDEGGDLFLHPADATNPKIKNEFSEPSSSTEIDALYEDSDPPYSRRTGSDKRNKLDVAGRFSVRLHTPARDHGRSRPGTPMAPGRPELTRSRATTTPLDHRSVPSSTATNADKVMIYVGNPHKKFRARRSGLDVSPLLSSLATFHPHIGWYLMSPLLSSLDAEDFLPVGQYLERGEYNPNILDEGTEWVRLEDNMTNQQRGQEVVRCGTVYSLAQTLELPGLEDLAFRKLKALAKQKRYQPLAILCVIDVVFESGIEVLRNYLVQYLADNYWDIVLAETAKLAEVMQANDELSKGVFGLLSGVTPLTWINAKIEKEQEVKREGKADSADETSLEEATPASSTMTARTLDNDEGRIDSGTEKIGDAVSKCQKSPGSEGKDDPSSEAQVSSGPLQPAEPELVLTEEEKRWMREDDEAATGKVESRVEGVAEPALEAFPLDVWLGLSTRG